MLSDTLLLLLISAVANAQIEIQTGKYRVSQKKVYLHNLLHPVSLYSLIWDYTYV